MKTKKEIVEKPVTKKLTDKTQQLNLAYALINAAKVALIRTMDSVNKDPTAQWQMKELTETLNLLESYLDDYK